eukprot:PRCOL_00003311-RA
MAPEPRGSQPLSAAVAAAQPGAGGEPVDTSLDARLKRVTERVAALSDALLVQVWRIVEVKAGPRSVETKDQPFSISTGAAPSLTTYREQSCLVNMQLLRGAVRAHMPGRVLLNAAPEWSPNVQVYREDEFIRRDQAFEAGVRATMAVPLFFLDDDSDAGEAPGNGARRGSTCSDGKRRPAGAAVVIVKNPEVDDIPGSGGRPSADEAPYLHNGSIGVLEVATLAENLYFRATYEAAVGRILEDEGLSMVPSNACVAVAAAMHPTPALPPAPAVRRVPPHGLRCALSELVNAYPLPLVQTWELSQRPQKASARGMGAKNGSAGVETSGIMLPIRGPYAVGSPSAWGYRRVCCDSAPPPRHSGAAGAATTLVGSVYLSNSIAVEPDLLSAAFQQCPLKQVAALSNMGASVAFAADVYESVDCGNPAAKTRTIFEIFFHKERPTTGDSPSSSSSRFTRQLVYNASSRIITSLVEIAATYDVGVDLPPMLKAAFDKSRPEDQESAMRALGLVDDVDQQTAAVAAGAAGAYPYPMAGANVAPAVNVGGGTTALAAAIGRLTGTPMSPTAVAELAAARAGVAAATNDGAKGSGSKRKMESKGITLPMLQAHFNMTLKDAAAALGLCTTTLKRVCRSHGISRWPCRKLKKMNCLEGSLQRLHAEISGGPMSNTMRTAGS